MKEPAPDIDPLLAAQLARAASGERVEALLLLRGEARAELGAAGAGGVAGAATLGPATGSASTGAPTTGSAPGGAPRRGDPAPLPAFVRAALGGSAAATIEFRPFPALGAAYVAGPAALMRRLLAAPEIASATLPDASE
jgi:hypothetical protein